MERKIVSQALKLRFIDAKQVTEAVAGLCINANICIGGDITAALSAAKERETSSIARDTLDVLLKNAEAAKNEKLPVCQDTGMVVVFVSVGSNVHIEGDIGRAINEGVRR